MFSEKQSNGWCAEREKVYYRDYVAGSALSHLQLSGVHFQVVITVVFNLFTNIGNISYRPREGGGGGGETVNPNTEQYIYIYFRKNDGETIGILPSRLCC